MKQNYDKQQLDTQRSIDKWIIINTVFTIINGLAALVLAFSSLNK